MRIFLSLLFLSFHLEAACEFKAAAKKVISLSGTSTVVFKELGLLSKLHGISVFNPISDKEFSGKVYPGGIFLSHSALSELEGSVVFYDESRDLKKVLGSRKTIIATEIHTRGLTPKESMDGTIKAITPYVQNCEDKITTLNSKIKTLEEKLLKKIPNDLNVVFYLGEFHSGRAPEFVMVNDGVVKWLKDLKKIKTYPTDLAYVNWSSKLMSEMPVNTMHVGVKDPGRDNKREIKRSSQRMTFIYPGSLVPGVTQLEAFLYWAESIF
ncbi:hypothetical protein [Peredibacter starrii]|uniref:Fe/B12 periplasmic-binding domain-containing protein n=1 Tax=Peredibacter starrii TaxID=28202 RepID=A0AAX4HSG5_9BACT|nr:hypothetical protein [Peredibacter starrii]WPU66328.1 hypothetical protein SOO65_06170 [Peredibacter starrii]